MSHVCQSQIFSEHENFCKTLETPEHLFSFSTSLETKIKQSVIKGTSYDEILYIQLMVSVLMRFCRGGKKSEYCNTAVASQQCKFLNKQLVLLSNYRSFQKLLLGFIKSLPESQETNRSKPFHKPY